MKSSKPTSGRYGKYGPKAQTSFRKNGLPVLLGVVVMVAVMALLNGELIMAQIKYHFDKPVAATSQTVASAAPVVDTKSPHPELGPQLTIPSINVVVPIELDQGSAEWQIQIALRSGVVHYDNSANPGQPGNVAIFGHSSGQPWAPGKYKFVFTLLDKVKPGDLIYIDYQGTRYTYKMSGSQVVDPTDVAVLQASGKPDQHQLALITCTPVGTSKSRLVVHAQQISPVPAKTDRTRTPKNPTTVQTLPGSAHGSLWQRIVQMF